MSTKHRVQLYPANAKSRRWLASNGYPFKPGEQALNFDCRTLASATKVRREILASFEGVYTPQGVHVNLHTLVRYDGPVKAMQPSGSYKLHTTTNIANTI